jgi:hypothetical protein
LLKNLAIIALFIWHCHAFSQSTAPPCDTCHADFKDVQRQKADSLLRVQKQSALGQKDSLLSQNKEKAKDLSNTQKDKINSKTDSSARAAYKGELTGRIDSSARSGAKNKVKGSLTNEMGKARSMPENKWKQLKSKLPERKNIIKFSGEIRSESFYATAQNPMMRNEPMYSRLYISPTITLFGLPFKSNFFFTTENNNTWKSNFFSIRFDVNAMRRQAMADMQKQLDEAKQTDRLRQVDLQKNILETQRYEQQLQDLKNQVPDADALQAELRQRAEEKGKAFLDAEKEKLKKKLRNAAEEEKVKLEREFKQKQDSIINHYKHQAGDSLLSAKGQATSEVDTAKLGKYLRMQSKLEQLKSAKEKIEQLRQADSAQLMQKVSGMRNPDDIRRMAKDKMPNKKLLNNILAVDRFGIGLVNPQYSEFTLFAASLKGIDIGVNKENYFYDLTLGKTTRQFTGPFSTVKPVYERMIGVARFGLGELKGDHVAFEYLYAFDPKSDDKVTPMIRNGVANLSGQLTMLKNTKIEANLAQSTYREKYVQERVNYPGSSVVLDASANRAYQVKATQTAGENVKIEAQLKQTGAAFRTAGNPFLRRNFRELELKYEQQFLKKKIKVSGFYKEMRDNLVELNSATNRLKGYGLKMSTAFEKYPNLSVGYSPYQQGNNHPDSAYRTNNQFSITTAMLTYKKRFKSISWNGLVNYTRSAMELNDRGTVAYRLVSTVHTLQVGQRHTSVFSYMSNVTAPFVDSLNSNSIQLNHTYLAKKSLSIGLIAEHTVYKNHAFRTGGGLQVTSTVLKNFTVSLLTRYDRINKLWKLDNADVLTGKLILVWRW